MVWWIPVAMAAASIAAKANDSNRRQHKRRRQYGEIERVGGLANYDPSVGKLQAGMGDESQGGISGFYKQLLDNFQGRSQDLTDVLQRNAPLLPGTLANTAGFEYAQNFEEPGRLPESAAMQGFGAQAGQMARTGAMGQRQAAAGLSARGLGNSAAMASLASQAAQSQGSAQASLYSQLQQRAFQERLANAQTMSQWAQRAFDMQRDIASMSMGAIGGQRQPQRDNSALYGQLAGAAGQAAAAYFGSGSGTAAAAAGGPDFKQGPAA